MALYSNMVRMVNERLINYGTGIHKVRKVSPGNTLIGTSKQCVDPKLLVLDPYLTLQLLVLDPTFIKFRIRFRILSYIFTGTFLQ
jgi:hypothetical protein